ncbi:hypothetical protein GCM10009745_43320 [Kribbella yunnanensis]|uniref:Methyltransferase domain-containing protein n=1 Tax=Kribbella yunnanensis TaxID=190194 RepID=A0ABP4TWK3_9ACTN
MSDEPPQLPGRVRTARELSRQFGFDEDSEDRTGALLRSLAATKPDGHLLELGTGTGIGTAWLLDGMNASSRLLTIDRNPETTEVARKAVGDDSRVELIVSDIGEWLDRYDGPPFDLVFVDTYRGKFIERAQLLRWLAPGGIYLADHLLPHPDWAPDQQDLVETFRREIVAEPDLVVTVLNWSSGLVLATKRSW